jgi:hypothetical protein
MKTTKILRAAVVICCPWNMVEESLFARPINSRVVGCHADTVFGKDKEGQEV